MKQYYGLLCLLLLFITQYRAQDQTTTQVLPDWNGDPALCTVIPPPTPSSLPAPPLPQFTKQAEFALERVEVERISAINLTLPSKMVMLEYLYDYDANKLIMVKNSNGFIDAEYYYYNGLKKSTYYRGEFCVVTSISVNDDMDGTSAIRLPDGTMHIRPLNEFLLFSNANQNPPVYIGQDTIRGIPVDKWQTCFINRTDYRTVRRIWAFARKDYSMPGSGASGISIPVQGIASASKSFPNGTVIAEVDEIYNVISYRAGIIETSDQLSPPKGVFCDSGPGQNLISLKDVGVVWPNRFTVRVAASSSRSANWQKFHLRYNQGRDGESRRLRYDYMPPGANDFESIIHDYSDNLTYTIDRRLGKCRIDRGVYVPDVNPIRDPIRFFIKYESSFIYLPPENVWEYNGVRSCRGNIKCTILTTSVDKFPPIVDPDTGTATGEKWEATNIEYGWSKRAPFAPQPPDAPQTYDYPVSLYLKMYRYEDPTNPSPFNLRTEDIEYEFYEMSREGHPYDFDTSICYRSLGYEYLHVTFIIKPDKGNVFDRNTLNRRDLERNIFRTLIDKMQIKFSRVSDLEVDHETASNEVSIFFTILGQTPRPESPSGFADDERTAAQARDALKDTLDKGEFKFSMKFDNGSDVTFQGQSGTLVASKQYMSTHTAGKKVVKESYSSGAQALAIIVGLLVGLVIGIIIAAVIRIVQKKPLPTIPQSFSNPVRIGFHKKGNDPSTGTSDA